MGIILSLLLSFIPALLYAWIVYWLDRYEKEPKLLLGGVFIWGVVIAAGGAFIINTVLGIGVYAITNSELATDLTTGSLIAPLVEESLKGMGVLVVFLFFRKEFDSVLDGIVYAGIVALGFAALENAYYIYEYGFVESGFSGLLSLTFIRVILVGWQHPFYTAFTGIGLAVARLNRNVLLKLFAPVIGWSVAVFTHSLHNTLASLVSGGFLVTSLVDWTGWLAMFGVILWAISRDRRWIQQYLQEEVHNNLISRSQYYAAISTHSQSAARLKALTNGRYRDTTRFFQVCAELCYKKAQRARLGEESHNSAIIQKLRAELSSLSARIGI